MDYSKLKINSDVYVEYLHESVSESFLKEFKLTDDLNVACCSVVTKSDLEYLRSLMLKLDEDVDSTIWVFYPKKSSKVFKNFAEVNRDTFAPYCLEYGIRPVALFSVSEDWSALRLRFVKYVKSK